MTDRFNKEGGKEGGREGGREGLPPARVSPWLVIVIWEDNRQERTP